MRLALDAAPLSVLACLDEALEGSVGLLQRPRFIAGAGQLEGEALDVVALDVEVMQQAITAPLLLGQQLIAPTQLDLEVIVAPLGLGQPGAQRGQLLIEARVGVLEDEALL